MAQLQTVSGIGSVDKFDDCDFGNGFCRLARTKVINDQGAHLSCSLCGPLCHGVDGVLSSHVFSM